jgi:hypothetical protein
MTSGAESRIDPAVDHVLVQVVTPVGQGSFGLIGVFCAGFELFFVRMAVGTERIVVAGTAHLFPL